MEKPLIVIAGPTALGKTACGIALAKRINGEIISGDSMQVYKYMDIGTAKPTQEEMQGVSHHLISILNPDEAFNAFMFQKLAKEAIEKILECNKIPILVGGTGFYINALVYDNNFVKTGSKAKQFDSDAVVAEKGADYLYRLLCDIDPKTARNIHPNNVKKVGRALSFYYETGTLFSTHNETQKEKTSPYQLAFICLDLDRQMLYERIDRRVDAMIEAGLVSEVEWLLQLGYGPELVSMQGLGYKEIVPYVRGEASLEDAVSTLKRNTRRFAKRQVTWFSRQIRNPYIKIDAADIENRDRNILNYIEKMNLLK